MKHNESAKTAWLVMLMDFFHYIALMCTKPYIKSLLNTAEASDAIAGFIIASFSLIQVVNALFLGKWIQKKGQKLPLVLGAAMYAIAGVFMAFASRIGDMLGSHAEIGLIALSVLLLGTSHGIFLLSGHYIITGIPREQGRDKYVGYLTFVSSIGQFIAPVLAAVILSEPFVKWIEKEAFLNGLSTGNEYIYVLLLSVFASVVSFALACVIKNVTNATTKKPAKVGAVIKDRPLMKIVFLNAAVYFSVDVIGSYMQSYGEETLLLSAAAATMVLSAMKFSAIFVRAFLGWLTKLLGSSKLLKISLLVISVTIVGIGLTNEISTALASLGLPLETTKVAVIMTIGLIYGLANGLVNPLAIIELSNASNDTNRGPALALRNMCNSGGQTLGDIAFGYILGLTSTYAPVFLISGGMLFGCFLISFDRKKQKPVGKLMNGKDGIH